MMSDPAISAQGVGASADAETGSREPGLASRPGPAGFDPARGEHPLALMESLLGAADEVEGWGAGLEAAIMRTAAAKLLQMFDALAVIEDVWTLPAPTQARKWHCQHEESLYAASEIARAAIERAAQ